jgi:hypothetical protein
MSNRINSIVTTIGIDIGKNVFHVVGLLQQLGQRQSFLGDRSSRALPVEVVTNSTLADWAGGVTPPQPYTADSTRNFHHQRAR